MKIYTRRGDAGLSATIGVKKRIPKSSAVFNLMGLIDELNAFIGNAVALAKGSETAFLKEIQFNLFTLGSVVAGLKLTALEKKDWESKTLHLEEKIDLMDAKLPELKYFVLPGGSEISAMLHLCRVKTRELERQFVGFIKSGKKNELEFLLPYINRLSDYFFTLSRYENKKLKVSDVVWKR